MLQVYWPSDLINFERIADEKVLIIGFNIENAVTVVVSMLLKSEIDDLDKLEIILKQLNLSIVGFIDLKDNEKGDFFVENGRIRRDNTNIILYVPPDPRRMQFYSIDPISIILCEAEPGRSNSTTADDKKKELIANHYDHRQLSLQEKKFKESVELLNTCWTKRREILSFFPKSTILWNKPSILAYFVNEIMNFVVISLNSYRQWSIKNKLSSMLIQFQLLTRFIFLRLYWLLHFKVLPGLPNLIELSATAQQIDLRLQQFCYFPIQYTRTMRKFKVESNNINNKISSLTLPVSQCPEYIRFYNTLWLIINDVTFGITLSAVLIENQQLLINFFKDVIISQILYKDLRAITNWLMNSPGGVKLNNELAIFFGELFSWVIEFWKIIIINPLVLNNLSLIVYILAVASTFGGVTLCMAMFSDFISIITFHIYCFYFSTAKIFNWLINILNSLFRLFCGKKINILRKRIDSNDYELDQLLLGTLLFIVLIFLLPTVLAFYLTFTILRLGTLVLLINSELIMSFLNHFPIFLLLLRLKDYKRIPGGIYFTSRENYLIIKTKPIEISLIFKPYSLAFKKLQDSYFSMKTVKQILTGSPLKVKRNKLYQSLYSGLPSVPMTTEQVSKELEEYL